MLAAQVHARLEMFKKSPLTNVKGTQLHQNNNSKQQEHQTQSMFRVNALQMSNVIHSMTDKPAQFFRNHHKREQSCSSNEIISIGGC